jgi:hypothetical protein
MSNTSELLSEPPTINKLDIRAAKTHRLQKWMSQNSFPDGLTY